MSSHPPKSRRRAAELVGRGLSYEEAGRAVGASKRQVTRWMRDGQLRQVARKEREEALDPTALGVLRGLLHSGNESIRLRAAALLLQNPGLEAELAAAAGGSGPTVTVFAGDLDA